MGHRQARLIDHAIAEQEEVKIERPASPPRRAGPITSAFDLDRLRASLKVRDRYQMKIDGFIDSAVLVPIYVEPGQAPRFIFTLRHADLPSHAGQISFPGGRRDPGDVDLHSTAIRETQEEIGVPPEAIEVIGMLDDIPSPARFMITPVVGIVHGPVVITPSEREVAEVFTMTLDQLRAPDCYRTDGTRQFRDVLYIMHEYHYEGRRIWGATARMLYQTLEALGMQAP